MKIVLESQVNYSTNSNVNACILYFSHESHNTILHRYLIKALDNEIDKSCESLSKQNHAYC